MGRPGADCRWALELRDRWALVVEGSTARTHVKRVLMKLGVRDRVQAVIYAYESGLTRAAAPSKEAG